MFYISKQLKFTSATLSSLIAIQFNISFIFSAESCDAKSHNEYQVSTQVFFPGVKVRVASPKLPERFVDFLAPNY